MTPNSPNKPADPNAESVVANLLVDGLDLAVDGAIALAQSGCSAGSVALDIAGDLALDVAGDLALEGVKCAAEAGVGLLASLLA